MMSSGLNRIGGLLMRKRLKRKWLIMGTSLVIATILILVSGFSVMANTSGYDAYKDAIGHNKDVASMRIMGTISITDNGTEIVQADINAKVDRTQNTASAVAKLVQGSEQSVVNMFKQDNQLIIKDDSSEVYKVANNRESRWKGNRGRTGPPKRMSPMFDVLLGNLKELATVEA